MLCLLSHLHLLLFSDLAPGGHGDDEVGRFPPGEPGPLCWVITPTRIPTEELPQLHEVVGVALWHCTGRLVQRQSLSEGRLVRPPSCVADFVDSTSCTAGGFCPSPVLARSRAAPCSHTFLGFLAWEPCGTSSSEPNEVRPRPPSPCRAPNTST